MNTMLRVLSVARQALTKNSGPSPPLRKAHSQGQEPQPWRDRPSERNLLTLDANHPAGLGQKVALCSMVTISHLLDDQLKHSKYLLQTTVHLTTFCPNHPEALSCCGLSTEGSRVLGN